MRAMGTMQIAHLSAPFPKIFSNPLPTGSKLKTTRRIATRSATNIHGLSSVERFENPPHHAGDSEITAIELISVFTTAMAGQAGVTMGSFVIYIYCGTVAGRISGTEVSYSVGGASAEMPCASAYVRTAVSQFSKLGSAPGFSGEGPSRFSRLR